VALRDNALELLCQRVLSTHEEIGKDVWPHHADPKTGKWNTVPTGDWIDGHWIDMLRMTGELLDRPDLLEEAFRRVETIRYKLETDDMFRGHRFFYSAARLYATTGDEYMRTLALAAAWAMRSTANKGNGAIPVGSEVVTLGSVEFANEVAKGALSRNTVCIDNVHPGLILDWWAWKETGDNTFVVGAERMLKVLENYFIREDGSTIENIQFEWETGELIGELPTLLGYADDSCWSRGQSWAIAGNLWGYEHTRNSHHLEVAGKLFDYWWNKVGPEVPPWDFDDPSPDALLDTSAAGIVCSALARLAVLSPLPEEAKPFTDRLEPMLENLCKHLTPVDGNDKRPEGMLVDGCMNGVKGFADRHELIWGDYYLMEALYCLEKKGLPC
jgi:unsaturated chondroitin disaccharide hydrolase